MNTGARSSAAAVGSYSTRGGISSYLSSRQQSRVREFREAFGERRRRHFEVVFEVAEPQRFVAPRERVEDGKCVGTPEEREQFRDGFFLLRLSVLVEVGAIPSSAFEDRFRVGEIVARSWTTLRIL